MQLAGEYSHTCIHISHPGRLTHRPRRCWSSSTHPKGQPQSPWQIKLAEALRQAGVNVVLEYPIAGRFLDLAILTKKLDVEVDGESVHRTAGGGRKDDDHWRDLQLHSLGWPVVRF